MRPKYSLRPLVATLCIVSLLVIYSFLFDSLRSHEASGNSPRLQPRGRDHEPERNGECILVHKAKDQCAFIKANCPDEEAGVLSYLTLYYCRLPSAKPVGFVIIAVWLGLLFATIGIAASDFLSVNLSTIAAILGMSEALTGVTFLAFGNGSPDVFSTLAAMKSHSGSLAIGELIGAASFISAFVAGSMAVIRPFKVGRKTFVREVGFFIVAVAFSMIFLANGKLDLWESVVMVGFYIFYVITVMIWHWYSGQRRKRRERDAAARGHYVIPGHGETEVQEEYHDEETNGHTLGASSRTPSINITTEDLRNLEHQGDETEMFPDLIDEDDEETRDRLMGEMSSNMRLRRPGRGERRNTFTPIRPSLLGALEFQIVLHSLARSRNLQTAPINLRRYSDDTHHILSEHLHPDTTSASRQTVSVDMLDGRGALSAKRTRAVSTNDASKLVQRAQPLRGTIPEIDLLSASPPEIESGFSHSRPQIDGESDNTGATSPHRSDSDPEATTPDLETTHQGGQDFLAPPSKTRQSNLTYPPSHAGKPQLSVTPPAPRRSDSDRSSPRGPSSPYSDFPMSVSPVRAPSLLLPSPSDDPDSYFSGGNSSEEACKPLTWWPYSFLPSPYVMFVTCFPTLRSWRDKNWWERGFALVSVPPLFLLTITIPVVEAVGDDNDEKKHASGNAVANAPPVSGDDLQHMNLSEQSSISEEVVHPHVIDDSAAINKPAREWNRWLIMIQCFTAPYFIVLTVWANTDPTPGALVMPTLYSLLASLLLLILVLFTTTPSKPPRIRIVACLLGFAVSIAWLSVIAGEIVGSLKTIGVILNISDAILGLTVFAVGNSINDLVADVTIAKLGFPVMALSACFAGPLLNILMGIGIGGIYMTTTHANKKHNKHPDQPMKYKPYHIDVSYTLLVSAISLLITLVSLLIIVPLNGWRMDRKIGFWLIGLWSVTTVFNLVIEVTGWDRDVA